MATVASAQSTPDQMEIYFRRLLASVAVPTPVPTPVPEPPAVERLLQRLVAETQVRQPEGSGTQGSGTTATTGIFPARL